MRRSLILRLAVSTMLVLVALTGPASATTSRTRPGQKVGCQSGWTVIDTPRTTGDLSFKGAASLSRTDAWAVGGRTTSTDRALIEHWDGSRWKVSSTPELQVTTLTGVAATAPTDAWAVGPYSADLVGPVIEHWDGSGWTIAAAPEVIGNLMGVTATSGSDAWAAGYALADPDRTLVEHWDGTSWAVASTPNVGHWDNQLLGVAASSPTDVWAVGWRTDTGGHARTLVEHWDGFLWTPIRSPNLGGHNFLRSVTVRSATDVWAGGDAVVGARLVSLVEHWDGVRWSIVSFPDPDPSADDLITGVSVGDGAEVWAVGNVMGTDPPSHGFTERWDGSAWTVVEPAPSGSMATAFWATASGPDGDTWVVGNAKTATGPTRTLTERICTDRDGRAPQEFTPR